MNDGDLTLPRIKGTEMVEQKARGRLIAVTGIPSSGKSTVSRELIARTSTFRYFDGDAFIRAAPWTANDLLPENLPAFARRTLDRMMDEVEERMKSSNTLLDVTLPPDYVERSRERFARDALFVGLRIDEEEWRRRDSSRPDRPALQSWSGQLSALQGPEDLFDLVLDTTVMPPPKCAEAILVRAREAWDETSI